MIRNGSDISDDYLCPKFLLYYYDFVLPRFNAFVQREVHSKWYELVNRYDMPHYISTKKINRHCRDLR